MLMVLSEITYGNPLVISRGTDIIVLPIESESVRRA